MLLVMMKQRTLAFKAIQHLFFLFLVFNSCENPGGRIQVEFFYPVVDSLFFSDCGSYDSGSAEHSLRIRRNDAGYITFYDINSELCCETDSLLVWATHSSDSCKVEIIDMGPYAWCFCPRTISFRLGPVDTEQVIFTVLESQSSYKRDTFSFTLEKSFFGDTVVFPQNTQEVLKPELLSTELFGCNNLDSALAITLEQSGPDTTWVEYRSDTIILITALNYGCCAPFETAFDDTGDTLIFYVEDLCNYPDEYCYCDCSCYYYFAFKMKKREESLFPYEVYLINAFNENPVMLWWGAIDTRVFSQ